MCYRHPSPASVKSYRGVGVGISKANQRQGTRLQFAGERSDRSANLERDETEGTANAVDIVEDGAEIGAEGGGGMRHCFSKTARMRCKKQGKQKKLTQLTRTN